MVETIESTIEAIRAAFRGVPRGEITLHEAEVIDSYGTAKERAAARRRDTEERWEEIPDKQIEECSNALSHLDPQSWRYYLPRYMEWTLVHHTTSRSITVDHTIYALLLGGDASINDYLRARYRQLTPEQSRAVSRFLQIMARADEHADAGAAGEALQKYWHKLSVAGQVEG